MMKNAMCTEFYLFVNLPNCQQFNLSSIEAFKTEFMPNLRREFYGAVVKVLASQVKYSGLNIQLR